jgi:hypothetical protein
MSYNSYSEEFKMNFILNAHLTSIIYWCVQKTKHDMTVSKERATVHMLSISAHHITADSLSLDCFILVVMWEACCRDDLRSVISK